MLKERIKGIIIGLLIGTMLSGTLAFAKNGSEWIEAMYSNIKIYIDGERIEPKDVNGNSVEPFIYNGTTYLPVRAVGEAFGKTVDWDGATQSVYVGANKEGFEYLFDKEPYMVENANLYMRNNDETTKKADGWFYYDTGWKMQSAGQTYSRGMAITADSYAETKIHYNLNGKYSKLKGKIAFEDKYSDRVDESYDINIYGDDDLIQTYTIHKSDLPIDVNVNLRNCLKLTIELERPADDSSDDPNINLIEFKLEK